ncbi:hypothetical protein [Pantoea sp. CCBC3-3-1]|uniref:hypothetical protein n=1 Tax=Pantoea sp. CCBC3-3-1 TaxID=2490851 RepID=UPI00143D000E|nr:hypothetical protein [Pantoea sp. CCBC3-3-1]
MFLLSWLRTGGIVVLLCCLISGGLWLRHQLNMQQQLQQHNQSLKEQNGAYAKRINELATQLDRLSGVLIAQNLQQQQLEKESDVIRKQLRTLLQHDACAAESVPDDVIRLQREALSAAPRLPQ